jgi:pyrroloquinoline quinone biosynthesis protein B
MLHILVLGSAAGGGFPQWNCNDAVTQRARAGDPQVLPRTQSSLAASADGQRWVLLNASPDLRQQINERDALQPGASDPKRASPIRAVVLTNGDVDHVAGLLTLRESQPFAVYAHRRVLQLLAENSIFNVLNPEFVERREMPLDLPFALAGRSGADLGLEVVAFAVPGKVPLWREGATAPDLGTRTGDTLGLEIRATQGAQRFFYIPGCAALPDDLRARLRDAPLVFFDGTLWRDDEMIAAGTGRKTGQRMGHMSCSGADGAMAAFEDLGVARKVFIHINNSNPLLVGDSGERAQATERGWETAYDGMEIRL